jgi:CHAT domain-containing protein
VNVLGMIANPGGAWGPLDTENERRRIDEAIAPLQNAGRVHFQWVPGDTSEHLVSMMAHDSWHVFHFIGHGGVSEPALAATGDEPPKDSEDGYIVLADGHGGADEVSASKLGTQLQGDGSLRLVVLNCCDSARGAADNMFSSPGAALVRSGVPAVVAMQFSISDDAAIRFASGFYESVADNDPIERAITTARLQMHTRSDVEWGIPVLFTRSGTGRLFSIRDEPHPAVAAPHPAPAAADEPTAKQQAARQQLRRLFGFD